MLLRIRQREINCILRASVPIEMEPNMPLIASMSTAKPGTKDTMVHTNVVKRQIPMRQEGCRLLQLGQPRNDFVEEDT